VSEVSEGPGWWLASDGRWYAPEQAPGPVPGPGPGYVPPPGPPNYPPPMDPGYGYPMSGPLYGYVPVQRTNGLAVASLVCSLVWLGGLGSILAIIFGFVARAQIKRSIGGVDGGEGAQGNGLAIAGIIIGFVGLVAVVAFVIAVAALVHHCDQTGNCTTNTGTFGNFGS